MNNENIELIWYNIIPEKLIHEFINLLDKSLDRWFSDKSDTHFYKLIKSFLVTFNYNIHSLIDDYSFENFSKIVLGNKKFIEENGLCFFEVTLINIFHKFLLKNRYEGPKDRCDYIDGFFVDYQMKIICKEQYPYWKDLNYRLYDLVNNYENSTKDDFIYLTKKILYTPLNEDM